MRTHALLLGTVISLSLLGCEGESKTERIEVPADLHRLEVDSGAGDVAVYGDDCENVEIYAVVGPHAELEWDLDGGVLRVSPDCGFLCGIGDVIITVPYDVDVEVSTGAGDVKVADILGSVWADTGAGSVDLDRLGGDSLAVDTGAGDVKGHSLSVSDAMFDTGAGNVDASFVTAPADLLVDTGAGNVDLALPRGSYHIDIDTGAGDVDIDGISHDASSKHRISIDTGAGNVDLHGR